EDVFRRLFADDIDHVVGGDRADQVGAPIDDRNGHQVVLGHDTRDFLFIHRGRDADDVLVADRKHRGGRTCDQQAAQRHRADQVAVAVDDVELEGPLAKDRLADVLDGVFYGRVFADGHEVRRHQPAGRVFGELEDLLDVLGFVLLHELQDLLGFFARQLLHDVGGVFRGHLVQDAGDLDLVERADQGEQGGVVEGGQDVAGPLRG